MPQAPPGFPPCRDIDLQAKAILGNADKYQSLSLNLLMKEIHF
jgi:hypothetical protein